MTALEYMNDENFRIYKKKLRFKNSSSYQNYYLVVKEHRIIDILWEKEAGAIPEVNLSYDNIELIVYKVVEKIDNRYFSFWNKDRIEYIINQEIQSNINYGMFFCKSIEQARNENFSDRTEICELKAKVKIDNLIGGNLRNLQFSKCIPIEIRE
ncbi:hypothetical protein B0P06_002232 [Clostridium saccharoperbutylacetonicum]|uniref:Uncharacterized protein n=1 Tax=Clostridium saccharoperbutylacetonicum N1-4(HMT) TaxID=931276 RepID=M1MNG3_9CLOT|nr:hypothetical protein [Clostridium saccharoperbutylacetonicum]AGF59429.1 hypothetical protein Cspa_c57040 [Clostridium saccharoperbutylacetonicum N1-4(HMT)]NRT59778.1 hypothetical protein [Clostridium saccharoperbutylacetonicum]NSB23090.1 hypothetical protein [Clostridium saccharoperbutylacetonicum]NSB42461.1 hypothetical protein [Clostridium saccharoperbutylacetonicum]